MNKKDFLILVFYCTLLIVLFFGCAKKGGNIKLARSYYKLALFEIGKENYKEALGFLDKALNQSNQADFLAVKGTVLFRLGKEEEGEALFNLALQDCSDNSVKTAILNNKACLLAQLGRSNNDNSKVQKGLEIWSDLEQDKDYFTPQLACFNQGKLYADIGDYDKAAQKLNQAVNISPDFTDAHFYLSMIAFNHLKDFSLAKREVEAVLFMEPNHEGAKKLQALLQKH